MQKATVANEVTVLTAVPLISTTSTCLNLKLEDWTAARNRRRYLFQSNKNQLSRCQTMKAPAKMFEIARD